MDTAPVPLSGVPGVRAFGDAVGMSTAAGARDLHLTGAVADRAAAAARCQGVLIGRPRRHCCWAALSGGRGCFGLWLLVAAAELAATNPWSGLQRPAPDHGLGDEVASQRLPMTCCRAGPPSGKQLSARDTSPSVHRAPDGRSCARRRLHGGWSAV